MAGVQRTGEGEQMRNTPGKMRVSGGLTKMRESRGLFLITHQRDGRLNRARKDNYTTTAVALGMLTKKRSLAFGPRFGQPSC